MFTCLSLRRIKSGPALGAFCLLIALAPAAVLANTNDRTINQFVHTAWTEKDGVPANILSIAETTDGFLWLGTRQGLYRFDGVTFELYRPESGAFRYRPVNSLRALPNGELWIGFVRQGVGLLRNGKCTYYSQSDGLPSGFIIGFVQDHEGVVWVATENGLARFEDGRWKKVADDWGYSSDKVQAMYVDRRGTLWVASRDSIVFLPQGSRRFQSTGSKVGQVVQITESPSGMLWMAETSRSVRPIPLEGNTHGREPEVKVGASRILFADDGSLWIASLGDGLRRVPFPDHMNGQKISESSPAAENFTEKDGLSSDYSIGLLEDREDNIWVTTSTGIDRFRKGPLVPLALPGKFGEKALFAVEGGNIWVNGVAYQAWTHGYTWRRAPIQYYFPHAVRDSQGVMWLLGHRNGSRRTILRIDKGKLTAIADVPSQSKPFDEVLAQDRNGTLWLGPGLSLKNGKWEQSEIPPEVAGQSALSAFTDATGRVWFGLSNNVVVLDGSKVRAFTSKDGIDLGRIMVIASFGGHIWIGGQTGLAVLEGDSFRSLTPAEGDRFDGVTGIVADSVGNLFVSELRGVAFIPAVEVSKILQNPRVRVQEQILDWRDGLGGTTAQRQPYPTSLRGTDGRLWFGTSAGVAWIDPAHIVRNPLPPPVAIRSITANETRYPPDDRVKLPPQIRRLTIDYTALSFAVPERVRFRYKLEGYDKAWQDAGTRRQATYTNLDPRPYRFRVIACNNDGVWNETGASLDFSILPAWYQAIWFRCTCVGGMALLLWTLYQLRVRRLERQYNMRMEERVSERTRIARDLHDTLLQRLHGLMFEFQAARNMFQRRPEKALLTLDEAIMGTERAITESQEAIEGLRGEAVADNDIGQRLRATGEELVASRGADYGSPTFGLTVEGERRNLVPIIREGIYRIACEVIRNAFRHAQAHRIEVEILYDDHQFRMRIRDDGKGIDPQVLDKGGRAGHWGLPGVRERAQQMGAKLDFWSEVGAGTEVQLAVAASVAYERTPDRSRFTLFRGTQSHEHRS